MKNPLPQKSQERVLGSVVQFSIHSNADEQDVQVMADTEVAHYATALQSARELGCTKLAQEEERFSIYVPTVLVIAGDKLRFEYTAKKILAQEGIEYDPVTGSIDPAEAKKILIKDRTLTAKQFLDGIKIHPDLGTYTYFLEGDRKYSFGVAIEMAKRVFNYVVVMPDTPPHWSFGEKNYIMVSNVTSARNVKKHGGSAVLYTPTLFDLRKEMNHSPYGLFSAPPAFGTSILRAAGKKIAYSIINYPSPPLRLPKDPFFTNQEKSEANDREVSGIARAYVAPYALRLPLTITRGLEDIQEALVNRRQKHKEQVLAEKKAEAKDDSSEKVGGATDDDSSPVSASPSHSPARIKSLNLRMSKLEEHWMAYELNPQLLLTYPKMADATCPETAQFVLAWSELTSWAESVERDLDSYNAGEFEEVLRRAESAFVVAEANARKAAQSYLSDDERKKIARAKDLMAIATDESAATNERATAFKRANRELEGVLPPLNPKIVGLLEA